MVITLSMWIEQLALYKASLSLSLSHTHSLTHPNCAPQPWLQLDHSSQSISRGRVEEEKGENKVCYEDGHKRRDDGGGRALANPLGASRGRRPKCTRGQRDDATEDEALRDHVPDVRGDERALRRVEDDGRSDAVDGIRQECRRGEPGAKANEREDRKRYHTGENARHDEIVHWIGSEDAQAIGLFGDLRRHRQRDR